MLDSFGREIHYLRASLTDRCNLRCVYCMPEAGAKFDPIPSLLSDQELVRVIRLAAELGIDRVRLTGGEPTVRPRLVSLIKQIREIPGIQDIALTTNGTLLSRMAESLARAGLNRVNISIDSLDPGRFELITRRGRIEEVWRGVQAAERAGLAPIKLNAVIMRGLNDDDLLDLARLTFDYPWEMRFIEIMPIGSIADFQAASLVPVREMQSRIETGLGPLEPISWDGHGPARSYKLRGAKGRLGFISSVSEPFCAGCDRVRLTADGKLRLCLLRDEEIDVLEAMRSGANDEGLLSIMRQAIYAKPWGHGLNHAEFPDQRHISEIGG